MLYSLIVSFLYLTTDCHAKLEPVPRGELHGTTHLQQCLVEASRRFFIKDYDTITYTLPREESRLDQLILPALSLEYNADFLIQNLNHTNYDFADAKKASIYIIHIINEEDILDSIQALRQSLSWNPRAKFLVISSTIFDEPFHIARETSRAFWNLNVIDAIVMLAKNVTYYNIFSWYPFKNNNCGNNFTFTRVIDACSYGVIEKNASWFGGKLPTKFSSDCNIKARYSDWPPYTISSSSGIEVSLLNMIAAKLNLTIVLEAGERGNILENGSLFGDFQLLDEATVDLVIGSYATTYKRAVIFDITRSHLQESLVWCVPQIRSPTNLKGMIDILGFNTWILTLGLYLIMACLIYFFIRRSNEESASYKNLANCLLNLFAFVIGVPIKYLPRTSRPRFLMALFLLFSFHLDSLYVSHLTSDLSTPAYEEKYSSIEDIYQNNLKTYFIPRHIRYFDKQGQSGIKNIPLEELTKRWINCTDIPRCLQRVASQRDAAFLSPKLPKDYILTNGTLDGIHCLKQVVVTYPVTMVMRKGYPLYDRVDQILSRIVSAGFLVKWEGDVLHDRFKRSASYVTFEEISVKFKYLKGIFVLFLVSHLVSVAVFLLEISYCRIK